MCGRLPLLGFAMNCHGGVALSFRFISRIAGPNIGLMIAATVRGRPYFLVDGPKKTQSCYCIAHNDPASLENKCKQETGFSQRAKFGTERVWNDTPFYVMGVPPILIPDHNAIFQDGTEELLIAISRHFDVLTSPTLMMSPASPATY